MGGFMKRSRGGSRKLFGSAKQVNVYGQLQAVGNWLIPVRSAERQLTATPLHQALA